MRTVCIVLCIAAFVSVLSVLAGCTEVAPWQRGDLANPAMTEENSTQQKQLRSHLYSSREAGTVGAAGKGNGCGCY